ncbi:MAG TPA: hypothetical protein VK588_11360, partial [Chitinophagaceae bacterium]|nr:hypothetical protein [Chitinophagaceae bacterium]
FDAFEEKIEKRFIAFEEKMDKGFTGANQRMDKMDIKIDSNFRWVIGTIITLFVLNGFVPVLSKLLSNLIQ